MTAFAPHLNHHLATHHGVVDRPTILSFGHTAAHIDGWCRSGMLHRVHNGVFRAASVPVDFESRCLAACLACPELVIGGASAAHHWGFKHTARFDDPVTAIVPHGRRPVRSEVTIRRSNSIDPIDVVHDPCGIRWTSPPRTWFDRASTSMTVGSRD